ncbi:hypothetical protein Back11_55640 [Paenibacillus baekrokdamisoli]|uniref:Uncharacterized protein n=1 Tax=Paenibacillus baekrokdamisoli TaxID=1712516 RepID=A0A3G9JMF6_9BACL|nr:hypothetical protein Back11_55640 [Paenibacillus baekrokdamisoli]
MSREKPTGTLAVFIMFKQPGKGNKKAERRHPVCEASYTCACMVLEYSDGDMPVASLNWREK